MLNSLSWILLKMPDPSELPESSNENTECSTRGDSEYDRLVNETTIDVHTSQCSEEGKSRSFVWWLKALACFFILIVLTFITIKWGVPFAFEKVLYYSALFFNSILHHVLQFDIVCLWCFISFWADVHIIIVPVVLPKHTA